MRLIVLSEAPESIAVKIATVMGIPVISLSVNFGIGAITATLQPQNVFGIWLGELPSLDRYRAVYDAFLSKNIRLVNRPEQHAIAHQFGNVYGKLSDLTPDLKPVHTWTGVRHNANLRHSQTELKGKPLGRSFRVYLYRQAILTYAYSWEADDPLKWLTVEEEEAIFAVALAAAARLDLPFVAIDIGEQFCGRWVVIEVRDAQFSLLNHMPMISFWGELERFFSTPISC